MPLCRGGEGTSSSPAGRHSWSATPATSRAAGEGRLDVAGVQHDADLGA
eukprot:CAMPEP_0171466512 /NCGR_PEP_ID=MMETSP0945-20130129/9301_1 /TAXON_ID=109269 /ORGANISM="Vaucheria litorea, Strain CCMP2940" /LENGTH=48 /DNA_ID= /DNA_START= /DNA_END= /DNA_ORIENTATION=